MSFTGEEKFVFRSSVLFTTESRFFTTPFVEFAGVFTRVETRVVGVADVGIACTVSRIPLRRGPCWLASEDVKVGNVKSKYEPSGTSR